VGWATAVWASRFFVLIIMTCLIGALKAKTKNPMYLKHLKLTLSGVVPMLLMFFVSCSEQEIISAGEDEITTSVSVEVPDVLKSRSIPDVYPTGSESYLGESGCPSLENVDLNEHPLTYTVGVYVENKKASADEAPSYTLVEKQSKTASDANAYFNFRLLKNQKYRLVAYADFNAEAKANLEAISYKTELNDEFSDAFFAKQDFVAQENLSVTLKRPFGKLRLIARDFNTFASGEAFKIEQISVAYKGTPMLASDTFNALTGEFNYDENAQGDHLLTASPVAYAQEYDQDGKAAYVAVFTMYLPANFDTEDTPVDYTDTPPHEGAPIPESYMYPFSVTVDYVGANDGSVKGQVKRDYLFDIPVKRNWLTTVDVANFWTDNSGIKVTIDHCFDGEIKFNGADPVTVHDADELQAAISKIFTEAQDGKITESKIVLGENIDATDRIGFNFYNLKANGNDRSNRRIIIHLDLNGYKITTNGEQYPNWVDEDGAKHVMVGGLFHVQGVNSHLYIDDSHKDRVGGLEFVGDGEYAYPLVCCHNGGQVTINRGNFITSSPSEAIYVYESEKHRATVQGWVLNSLGIGEGSTEPKPTDSAVLAKIEDNVKKWTASVTINGGWYESAIDATTEDEYRVLVNAYNARQTYWDVYKNYWADKKGCPDWTRWGEYVNQPFGFVFVNGGSFVEFDPSKGDNMVGNIPNEWIGDGHVEKEIVQGKTVYTVVSGETSASH